MELHFDKHIKQINDDDLDLILKVIQMNDNLKERIRTELWDEHNGYSEEERKFSVKEVKAFLETQYTIENAIRNVNNINLIGKKITQNNKVLFFIPYDVKTKGELKKLMIDYMISEGYELSGYEQITPLDELMESLEWKIEE